MAKNDETSKRDWSNLTDQEKIVWSAEEYSKWLDWMVSQSPPRGQSLNQLSKTSAPMKVMKFIRRSKN